MFLKTILVLYNEKPEIPLWLFIVLVLVLAVIIGWIKGFFPSGKGNRRNDSDPSDHFDGGGDYF